MAAQPSQQEVLDVPYEQTFLTYLGSLPEKSETTIRVFDRTEFYTIHGNDAVFIAKEIFKTMNIVKHIGSGEKKIPSVALSKVKFESTIRELLLVRQYRVELYRNKGGKGAQQNWFFAGKASPGNLQQFEEILFGNNEMSASVAVMAFKLSGDPAQKIVGAAYVDVAERKIAVCEIADNDHFSNVEALLVQLGPKECIIQANDQSSDAGNLKEVIQRSGVLVTEKKKVAEFINKICLIKEHAATQLLQAVETFRKKGNEIKKESQGALGSISNTWEALLTDTEDEARELLELSQKLVNSISVPLFDCATKKKTLLKKVFVNRESLEVQADKTEEILTKCFKDYTDSWGKYKVYSKDPQKEQHVSTICYNCHNEYVWQLAGFNRTNEVLYETIIPELLNEAQETLNDVGSSYSTLMQQFTQTRQEKLNKRLDKLQSMEEMFALVNVQSDLSQYTQALGAGKVKLPIKSHENPDAESNTADVLGVKMLLNPLTEPALKRKYYLMNQKLSNFVNQIDKEETALKSLKQLRHSYIDNPSYGNPDGMCEDIMKSDFELKQKRVLFSVLATQLNLFTKDMIQDMGPMEGEADDGDSDGYTTVDRDNEKAAHQFVPYISRKPGLCAYCKGVLIGIVKPTVRCKVCKQIVHQRCEMNVPYCSGTPQPRPLSKFLAIRSKSIDSRTSNNDEEDDEDNHLYSDIDSAKALPKPRRRRHSGSSADGRAIFVNGSYGSSPNIVPSPPEIPTKPALKKKPGQCVILYDYDAKSPGDLSIKAGQRVTVINSSSIDWWEGSYKGKVGFFPASYALKLQDKDVVLTCLYDFEGEEDDELSIAEGQILVLITDEGNGWMVGRGADGEGIFPSTYVEKCVRR
ncbi:DNA mismatch repair Msh2-like [Paramuricea clavata]|uniref:DNA mismatch repair Msh2-like n=1 Tax=Paramuricea clavata TaxID=317549 RepID=A0A6S7FWY9_PARCT|nr:DNA mismatch repair Msh2-like [Paramuricea clavata]